MAKTTHTISVLIVDDEPLARARIRDLLKADPEVKAILESTDGFEAVKAIGAQLPDLVFLDIQMPEKNGFEVIEEVGVEKLPVIVFVTAYDEYALKAFEVYALDYLLKPFDESRFGQTLARAKEQIHRSRDNDFHQRLVSFMDEIRSRNKFLERVVVKKGQRHFVVKLTDVDWIQAEGNYVRLHVGQVSYLIRETIQHLDSVLPPDSFQRIHRSTIVNLDRIKEIQQLFHGNHECLLRDGTRLPLGRNFRDRLLHSS